MLYNPLPLLLALAGGYLLIKLRFFYILHPARSFGKAFGALRDKKSLTAFTLALAGTLGVGNVLGVALGIIVGGAGSVFWLILSAIPASVLKYSEVVLASDGAVGRGGMYWCIRDSFPRAGKGLSFVYAAACLLLSLLMGAALQSRSVIDAADVLGLDIAPTAVFLTAIVLISIIWGGGVIGKITLIVIPLTTIIYIFTASSVIIAASERLPEVIRMIISDAFSPRAGLGGVLGFLTSHAVREGFARGMLSNEAGAGTSTLAHACGSEKEHGVRGLLGVLEVFFDTVLLCTLTALSVLCAVPDPSVYSGGMELVLAATRSTLGGLPSLLVAASVFSFAYSTVICWYYYGGECVRQLFGREYRIAFTMLFLTFVISGALISERILVLLSDALLLIMTALTLPTLIKNSDRIVSLSESSGLLKKN